MGSEADKTVNIKQIPAAPERSMKVIAIGPLFCIYFSTHIPMQFDFGKNWIAFSRRALTPEKVELARRDFARLFKGIELKGKSFLDIGFGQGLSLLLAREAGADVFGNDINPKCSEALAVTASVLKTSAKAPLVIGSILEDQTMASLLEQNNGHGFDIVHSWGVLHHTGDMKTAIRNAASLVVDNGYLILAIYNRHITGPIWRFIKWLFCKSPRFIQVTFIGILYPVIVFAKFAVTRKNPFHQMRGMDFFFNVVDWVGGYPYEYAGKDEIIELLSLYGYTIEGFFAAQVPTGCNEFIFKKSDTKRIPENAAPIG
jgi:2-polyprenyl-3-methyl-5-hydroxy-6-metoxy-1,4-benzoquinol methylase